MIDSKLPQWTEFLEQNPRASVAITHDNEWIDMVEKVSFSFTFILALTCI